MATHNQTLSIAELYLDEKQWFRMSIPEWNFAARREQGNNGHARATELRARSGLYEKNWQVFYFYDKLDVFILANKAKI